jgi:hypothetical protein
LTEKSNRDIEDARSLHQDLRALFGSSPAQLLEIEARRQMRAVHCADAANAPQRTHCEAVGRRIPIVMQDRHGRAAPRELRYFTAGEGGPHESGVYAFWSVLAGPVAIFIFRSPVDRPIDERLREYIGKTARRTELLQQLADRVMPSTADEVELWLRAHPVDAAFALAKPESAPGAAPRAREAR